MKLFRKVGLVKELANRQLATQYRDSFFGLVWTVLNPLLNMLVMWFVFGNILNITDSYYPIYILTGNLMFTALRNSTLQCLNSLVSNRSLLFKTKTDLSIFPLSNVLTSIFNFFFSLIALLPFMIWLTVTAKHINLFTYRLVYIFFMLPAFMLFEYGIGLFLAILFVFFRDIKHIYSVFLTLWTYSTPLFYKMTRFGEGHPFLTVMRFNPMYHFVNYFRDCVYRGAIGINAMEKAVETFNPSFYTLGILYAFGVVSVILGYALYLPLKNKIITKL